MATLFRLPQIFKTWRRDPQGVATAAQDNVTENRNVALLAGKDTFFRGPGQAPNYDWPNPTLAKSRVVSAIFSQVQVWQNGLVTLLFAKDTFFRGPGQPPNYDWPNPTLAKSRIVSAILAQTQVWQNALVNVLAGKDAFFGGPGRGPNYDWPNPTLAKSRIVAAVFSQAQVWQNALLNVLVGKDTFFWGSGRAPVYDWPNPPRIDLRRWTAVQALVAPSLLVTVLATAAPFTPVDQPNPRGAVNRVAQNLWHLNLLATTLRGQDAIYGGAGQVPDYDWPNPRGPVNRIATLSLVQQNLFGSTLQALPTGQRELGSNPRGAPNRLAVSFSAPNSLAGILTPLSLPPGQALWINPPMRRLQATAVFAGSPLTTLSSATTTTTVHMRGFIVNLGPMTEQI